MPESHEVVIILQKWPRDKALFALRLGPNRMADTALSSHEKGRNTMRSGLDFGL